MPNAHRRLEDAHRLWHQAAEAYSAPDQFRLHLNGAIEALRSCVWMLQKRTRTMLDFETWHQSWHEAITQEEVLSWLLKAGNQRIGLAELEATSTAKVRLMRAQKLPPLAEFSVPVQMATKDIAFSLVGMDLPPIAKNPSFLIVERRWMVAELPNWELLEALAYGYALVVYLLRDAHRHGADDLAGDVAPVPVPARRARPTRDHGTMPCMQMSNAVRTVVLNLRTGRLQGPNSQWIERDQEVGDLVAQRFGGVQHLHQALTQSEDDPLYMTAKYFEDAKRTLIKEKMHHEAVRLYTPEAGWVSMNLSANNQQDRYSVWQQMAHEVARKGAKALLMVCEVPLPPKVDPARSLRPVAAVRRESLIMLAETAEGRHRTLTAPFHRKGDQIRFGRTRVESDGRRWHQMEPVRAVWGR